MATFCKTLHWDYFLQVITLILQEIWLFLAQIRLFSTTKIWFFALRLIRHELGFFLASWLFSSSRYSCCHCCFSFTSGSSDFKIEHSFWNWIVLAQNWLILKENSAWNSTLFAWLSNWKLDHSFQTRYSRFKSNCLKSSWRQHICLFLLLHESGANLIKLSFQVFHAQTSFRQ